MQIQITFANAYPAMFDTKDLTDSSSIPGVIIGSFAQLSYSTKTHPDPKTGEGEYAPGLWCHLYGFDYSRKDLQSIISPMEIAHVAILSAQALEHVLEVRVGAQIILKRDPAYGLIDLQTLSTVAATYLDNSVSMSMVSVISELHKCLSKIHLEMTSVQVADVLAKETAIPIDVVADALKKAAAMEDGEDDEDEDDEGLEGLDEY